MILRRILKPTFAVIAGWQIGYFSASGPSTIIESTNKDTEKTYLTPGNIFDGKGELLVGSVSLENTEKVPPKFELFYLLPKDEKIKGFWDMP